MTQDELGDALGVTGKAVSGWERETSVPKGARAAALRTVLKVTYVWLLEGVGEPPSPDDPAVLLDSLTPAEQAEAAEYIKFRRHQSGQAA